MTTAYCQLSDVQSYLWFTLSGTSNPTDATVINDVIPEVSRRIDERLAKYYVTPITGQDSLLTINRIARWLAAAEVADRVYLAQTPSESTQATAWRQQAEADLKRIATGEIILFDAVSTSDTPEVMSRQISDNLSAPTRLTPPVFSMGKQF